MSKTANLLPSDSTLTLQRGVSVFDVITGKMFKTTLQGLQSLFGLASSLSYAGAADPTTNPGTPTGKVFYTAAVAGIYTNFKDSTNTSLMIGSNDGIVILSFNGTSWVKQTALLDLSSYAKATDVPSWISGKNLFNKATVQEGKAIHTSGTILTDVAYANWSITAPIPVNANTTYTYSGGSLTYTDLRVRFEDSSHNLISVLQATATPFSFTTPANCAFILLPTKVNSTDNSVYNTIQVEIGSVASAYQAYTIKIVATDVDLSGVISATDTTIVKRDYIGKNKLDSSQIVEGSAINNTGSIVTATGYAIVRIACKPSQIYTFSGTIQNSRYSRVRFENTTYGFLSMFDPNASGITTTPFSFTTPVGCSFLVINTKNAGTSDYTTLQLEEGATATAYQPYFWGINPAYVILPNINTSHWANKTITFFGDSITAQGYYCTTVASVLSALYNKDGVSGSCITPGYGAPDGSGGIVKSLNDSSRIANIATLNGDAIVIFAGTNDYYYSVPLGAITDTATTSFYGACKNLLSTLIAQNPTKRILQCTPLQRFTDRTKYDVQKSYAQAIKDVAALYAVPVLDLFSVSGITFENIASYTVDNTHPDQTLGAPLVGRMMAAALNNL